MVQENNGKDSSITIEDLSSPGAELSPEEAGNIKGGNTTTSLGRENSIECVVHSTTPVQITGKN